MLDAKTFDSSIAQFDESLELAAWPEARAIDALFRECARLLFTSCRADYRAWLSEPDLQSMLFAILRRELPAHGLPACAVHAGYPCRLPAERISESGGRSRTIRMDVIVVVPRTIHRLRGRRWEGELSVAAKVKRGYERLREISRDLAKLAAIRAAFPKAQTYMIVMGYHGRHEHIAAADRAAKALDVTLLHDNYWGQVERIDQPELV